MKKEKYYIINKHYDFLGKVVKIKSIGINCKKMFIFKIILYKYLGFY